MIAISTRIIQRPPSAESIMKQINFGTAVGLTKTAKDGQAAVVSALGSTFTLRGNWFQQSNKFGIRIKSATKTDLSAAVQTNADWLELHETGGDKTRHGGGRLTVPTDNVRRNKRLIIPRSQRPQALRSKNTFIKVTKRGETVLFKRVGRGKNAKIVALYILESKVRIRKESTFYEPIQKIVAKNLSRNIEAGIQKALATAR